MYRPSGDQLGPMSSAGSAVSRRASEPPTSFNQMSKLGVSPSPRVSPSQEKATWLPSGENVGVASILGRAVSGTSRGAEG